MTHDIDGAGLAERLQRAAQARQAMLAKFRPRPAAAGSHAPSRAALKAETLTRVRTERAEAKAAKQQAVAAAAESARLNQEATAQAALDEKRGQRKERKALTKAEAKAKRDARYAARKARK